MFRCTLIVTMAAAFLAAGLFALAEDRHAAGPGGVIFRRGGGAQPQKPAVAAPTAPATKPPVESSGPPKPEGASADTSVDSGGEAREVDSAEVLRRGDRVTRAGRGPESRVEQLFGDATAPPPDDSHKWFVTIIVDDSAASQALQYDLKHSPSLRAWINLDEPKDSWSHATVYKKDDQTQHWRWSSLQITQFPCVVIQPPAKLRDEANVESWVWGNPKTVVWQWDGYDVQQPNRAQLRSDAIRKALGLYVTRYAAKQQTVGPRGSREVPPPTPGSRQGGVIGGPEQRDDYGIAPPFSIPQQPTVPTVPIFPVDPSQLPGGNPLQPQTPSAISLLLSLFGGAMTSGGLTNVLMISLIGVQLWRAFRKGTGQPTLLDDESFAKFENLLKTLAGQQQTPKQ